MTELTTATVMAEYANMPLMLSMYELMNLFDLGLISEADYVLLALKLEKAGSESTAFDIDEFCERWECPERENGKAKRPKAKTVLAVLRKLEEAGLATVERPTVQLSLSFDL